MNVAIVAPSPVPFVMGGAENLWLGLQRFINEETKHHCELFKIPTKEDNLLNLLLSYQHFSELNYGYFDRIITTKYPAWMVKHPYHVVYVMHTLRGLYDTYHFCGLPDAVDPSLPAIKGLIRVMESVETGAAPLSVFFSYIFDAYNELTQSGLVDFPGPLARQVIHFLDQIAMSPANIRIYSAISHTVAKRQDYFPANAHVNVLYPPPHLNRYYCKDDNYLFTTSRLDGPKRVGLLVEAMRHVTSGIRLLIGGKGPDEDRLRELAGDNERVQFLGYLTDDELLEHYANALAIPFVPYDEDYGLITIEAMKSGKPVITTTDSGGVCEFVIHGETGMVAPPEPTEIAKAIDYLSLHRDKAREMGRNARKFVAEITWQKVAEGLLGIEALSSSGIVLSADSKHAQQKKKMVVATTFPIFPPRGGGQSRIFHLYREWAKEFTISIISLAGVNEHAFHGEIANGLTEIRVPKTLQHQSIEDEYSSKVGWVPITDIVAGLAIHKTPKYLEHLKRECREADIVVASHPFMVNVLRECAPDKPLWFEAHNVECLLKRDILPETNEAEKLLEIVKKDEMRAWKEAQVVFACTHNDIVTLSELFGTTNAITCEVPNGFSVEDVVYHDMESKKATKDLLELSNQPTVVFMGSWHGPNLEAVERIIEYAKILPSVLFMIVGSAGFKFTDRTDVPGNMKFLGVVDDHEKQVILSASDLAINPMTSGSGSNLKMFDYMGAGVPVLTTAFGARGMIAVPDKDYMVADIGDFPDAIMSFFIERPEEIIRTMCISAVNLVTKNYSWEVIACEAKSQIFMKIERNTND